MATPATTSSDTPPPSHASIHSLPAELIEQSLIFTACRGFPTAISALARTCRAFHALVYHSPDAHLWREVFLVAFDDPRKSAGNKEDAPGAEPWDWGAEFRSRVWAARRWARKAKVGASLSMSAASMARRGRRAVEEDVEEAKMDTRALEVLMSVADTALPYPPTIALLPEPNAGATPPPGFVSFPIFPPCPDARAASKNVAWLEDLAARGLPSDLARRLSGRCWEGGTLQEHASEVERTLAQVLGRVVAYVGFVPARGEAVESGEGVVLGCEKVKQASTGDESVGEGANESGSGSDASMGGSESRIDASMSGSESGSRSRRGSGSGSDMSVSVLSEGEDASEDDSERTSGSSEGSGSAMHMSDDDVYTGVPDEPMVCAESVEQSTTRIARLDETFIAGASIVLRAGMSFDASPAAQAHRARRLARMRVYNLRYLSAWRAWGPFHLVDPHELDAIGDDDNLKGKRRADGHPAWHGGTGTRTRTRGRASGYAVDSDDEDNDWAPLPGQRRLSRGADAPPRTPPPNSLLTPDWAYLAAVRGVVEANLREAVGQGDLAGLTALDALRAGSAPVDLSGGGRVVSIEAPQGSLAVFQGDCTRALGKGREVFGEVPNVGPSALGGGSCSWERDWAGVTGVWRRCICWLDYRELIKHNLSSDYNDPQLTEAVRIVPMRLRAVSYSAPAVAAHPDKPTIHIAGETAAHGSNGHVRRLWGTVSVVKDGSIRWTIALMAQEEGDPTEWVTEGVQVGGPKSAMGVLGFWTSSQHERMEPLGPFWAWKVG